LAVTLRQYDPELVAWALLIEGFWLVELNPAGPVQLYVPPITVTALNCSVWSAQIGPLLLRLGTGIALTVTACEQELVQPSNPVTVRFSVNDPALLAVMVTDWFELLPAIEPLPLIDQA
jgi:hypothetical protein